MSFSNCFHLTSGSRGQWGYDYSMYTCMNPDLAGFHNMASIVQSRSNLADHKIWKFSLSAPD